MNPTADDVKRAVAAAHELEAQGYFAKAKSGDDKAASYFVRMVAARVNPTGNPHDWGWLSKGGGFNIEGFADGAIVFGNSPGDRENVLKLVLQVGSSHPNDIQIAPANADLQPRRDVDVWASPVPVPAALGSYLLNGGEPRPIPPPVIQHPAPGREEMMNAGTWLDSFYRSPEGLHREHGLIKFDDQGRPSPDWEGVGAWLFDVYWNARLAGKSEGEARAAVIAEIQKTGEWKGQHP